jgi:dihydrofolate reductase
MARLTITSFVTLDGVMQAPGGPHEDPSGGFTHGGWFHPYFEERELGGFITGVFRRATAFLLGRGTYQIFAAHWPRVPDAGDPVAGKLNALPKYVASRTLERADWKGSTLVRDVPREVARLKAELDGELQVHGSPGLIQTLLQAELADELNVILCPITLGGGKRLFGSGTAPAAFELAAATATSTGAVIATYRRKGRPATGSFALE